MSATSATQSQKQQTNPNFLRVAVPASSATSTATHCYLLSTKEIRESQKKHRGSQMRDSCADESLCSFHRKFLDFIHLVTMNFISCHNIASHSISLFSVYYSFRADNPLFDFRFLCTRPTAAFKINVFRRYGAPPRLLFLT